MKKKSGGRSLAACSESGIWRQKQQAACIISKRRNDGKHGIMKATRNQLMAAIETAAYLAIIKNQAAKRQRNS